MDDWWDTKTFLIIQDSFPRAIAGISSGIAAQLLVKRLKGTFNLAPFISRLVVWAGFFLTIYFAATKSRTKFDFLQVILFWIIIVINGMDKNYLSGKVTSYLNGITLDIYLNQLILINLIICFVGSIDSILCLIIMLIGNFLSANITYYIRRKYSHGKSC